MTAPFSIIIPSLNAAGELPATLNALLPGLERGMIAEVIISDGGSTDRTLELADEAGAEVVTGAPGRGGQLRRGAVVAKADWLLVLHADTHLPPNWPGALGTHIAGSTDAAVFRLSFRDADCRGRFTAWFANQRTRLFDLPYGDQGLLISRTLYDQIEGYPDQPLMEDVEIAKALKGRIILLDEAVTTSPDRYQRDGWMKRGIANLWTLLRYRMGVPAVDLAKRYHKT
jgi:rSAM/selenodomain-associated transferase 2